MNFSIGLGFESINSRSLREEVAMVKKVMGDRLGHRLAAATVERDFALCSLDL